MFSIYYRAENLPVVHADCVPVKFASGVQPRSEEVGLSWLGLPFKREQ